MVGGGAVAAALALLPGLIAALIALIDLGAQSVLGMSGLIVTLATGIGPTGTGGAGAGNGLPAYEGVDRSALAAAIASSFARAVPGILLCAIAMRPPRWRVLRSACIVLSLACLGAAASTPGRFAALAALVGAVAISGPDG